MWKFKFRRNSLTSVLSPLTNWSIKYTQVDTDVHSLKFTESLSESRYFGEKNILKFFSPQLTAFCTMEGGYNLSFRVQLALERSRNPKKYLDYVLFGRSHFADIHPCVHGCHGGKITLHLLFGWSLDKDEKSLDQSKQFSWQFGSIQTKASQTPTNHPLKFFW